MASLAQPSPKSPRKLLSVRDKWRAKTNYHPKRFTGYAPISFAMVAEIGRLTAGKATQLLYVILTASLGQMVSKDEAFREMATDIRTSELAELCGCDERTIQRELTDLTRRNVIAWGQTKKGVNTVTALFRHWEGLPDYKPAPVLEPEENPEDEPAPEDPAQNAKETTYLTKAPVYVKAGAKSKRTKVDCGVAWFQVEVKGQVDAEHSAVVQDGVLRVIIEGKWDGKSLGKDLLKQKEIPEKPRQGCRISPNESRGKGTKGERRSKSENATISHPRAEELSSLFDPLLLKWCGKTLSGDSSVLLKACEAVGQADHDFLVKAVIERASRTLTPLHVPSVCKEIAHNWERAKNLPPDKKLPTRAEIDAMIAQERAERMAKKRRSA